MEFHIPRYGIDRTILDEFIGVVRRRKLLVLATLLGMTITVYVGLSVIPERYEAEARLLVMLGRENIQVPVTVQKGGVYASGVQREEINSDIQLIRSRGLIESVVDAVGVARFRFEPPPPQTLWQHARYFLGQVRRWIQDRAEELLVQLGLKKELTEREKAIELVDGALDVSREGESNVIQIQLRLPSRQVAVLTVEKLVDLYFAAARRVAGDGEGTAGAGGASGHGSQGADDFAGYPPVHSG
jgi:uncharacterized protein involved in exopolysaccharide biosynthesis